MQTEAKPVHLPHVGICPVCNGTKRQNYTGPDAEVIYGFDPESKTLPCRNCGGQYMFGTPLGLVVLNANNIPCTHEYKHVSSVRCLHTFQCIHCLDTYQIDSGD